MKQDFRPSRNGRMHFVFTPQPTKLLNYYVENQITVFNNVQDLNNINLTNLQINSISELLTFALQKNALGIILAAWMASRSQLPQIITILSLEKAHGRYGRSSPEHCGYSRYLLNQGTKTQYSGGKGGAASCPWLIPAGKLVSSHRAQGPPPNWGWVPR